MIAFVSFGLFKMLNHRLVKQLAGCVTAARLASDIAVNLKYRDLIDAQKLAKCGSWTTDAAGGSLSPSAEYLNMLELDQDTCPIKIQDLIDLFIKPENLDEVNENLKRMNAGESYEGMRRVRLKSGREKWLHFRSEPLLGSNGEVTGHCGIAIDITEQRQAAIALAKSEERFRGLAELSSDWYLEQDSQFRFTFLSDTPVAVEKFDRPNVIGKTRWEIRPDALTPTA